MTIAEALYHEAPWPGVLRGGVCCSAAYLSPPEASVDYSSILVRVGLVVACLAGPVLWGVVVNWLFSFWQSRSADQASDEDEPVFPDYQI